MAAKAYKAALSGKRPNAKGENIIWGWGKISQLTSGNPKFRDVFFEARYHVALTRFLMGKATKDQAVIEQSAKDITAVEALYPKLGGPENRNKFDLLLKRDSKVTWQTGHRIETHVRSSSRSSSCADSKPP